jgi:hypothetical protein
MPIILIFVLPAAACWFYDNVPLAVGLLIIGNLVDVVFAFFIQRATDRELRYFYGRLEKRLEKLEKTDALTN